MARCSPYCACSQRAICANASPCPNVCPCCSTVSSTRGRRWSSAASKCGLDPRPSTWPRVTRLKSGPDASYTENFRLEEPAFSTTMAFLLVIIPKSHVLAELCAVYHISAPHNGVEVKRCDLVKLR